MKRIVFLLAVLLLGPAGKASAKCRILPMPESVEVGPGELSLADLLPPGDCPALYPAAARVVLGAAPRAGSERVLDGGGIRLRLEQLENGRAGVEEISRVVPARIVVRLAGARMSCAEVARFVAGAVREVASDPGWQNDLHCNGAGHVPAGAALALTKTDWNPMLHRWEFTLRCARSGECVPFVVWSAAAEERASLLWDVARDQPQDWVVKRGETATLTWDQGGIRVVLPVMCLEAGKVGQSIRVRVENAGRTLRAEVVGAGVVRVSL
jgi:hypothetical protein